MSPLAGVLALVAAALGGWVWSLRRSVRQAAQDGQALARGDVLAVSPTAGSPEVQALREALNRVAEEGRARARVAEREQAALNALMDRMDEGVLALSAGGTVRVANRAAREVLAIDQDPGGVHLSRVRPRELRAVLEAALQTSIRPRQLEVDDRMILVESNLQDDGVAIMSLRDVTDVRRLEEVRTDFVANASHELKTPLTAVRGFAETLIEDDPPEETRRQFLTLIHDNTLRLQAIVEDLLDLSRLESGGWKPELGSIQVAEVALQAWDEVVEGRGTTRSFKVKGDAWVLADHGGLMHILRNLLDNALRHTEADGTVRVEIRQEGAERVRITVADNGTGIPPEALGRVFERFFRVDKARSRAKGGTGLGLAIVSHLTSRMGGAVEAESQFGVGTRMHVFLPPVP